MSEQGYSRRPTIDELEAILSCEDVYHIVVMPNGEVRSTSDEMLDKITTEYQEKHRWKYYKRKCLSEMRPYIDGEDLTGISVSEPDKNAPMTGGMIARNPKNHADQWFVAKKYFDDNLEPA